MCTLIVGTSMFSADQTSGPFHPWRRLWNASYAFGIIQRLSNVLSIDSLPPDSQVGEADRRDEMMLFIYKNGTAGSSAPREIRILTSSKTLGAMSCSTSLSRGVFPTPVRLHTPPQQDQRHSLGHFEPTYAHLKVHCAPQITHANPRSLQILIIRFDL